MVPPSTVVKDKSSLLMKLLANFLAMFVLVALNSVLLKKSYSFMLSKQVWGFLYVLLSISSRDAVHTTSVKMA